MAGDRVILIGDTGGRIRSFVSALQRFPDSPAWVVVGGFAVNARISQVHRLTNDLDTISAQQSELIETLLAQPGADRLDHAKLRFTGEAPAVDIDVMDDTSRHSLPLEPGDRAFALARRYAMQTREQLAIVVTEGAEISVEATAPVASVAALVALKSVSMPRRLASNHPEKVASDAHDLTFAFGQHVEACRGRDGGRARGVCELGDDTFGDRRVEEGLAGCDDVDRSSQVGWFDGLERNPLAPALRVRKM